MRRVLFAALGLLSLSAPAVAAGKLPVGLPVEIQAAKDASYQLVCRYRPIKVDGILINTWTHDGKGAFKGNLPTDNGRCTLTKTAGTGPITLIITKNGQKSVVANQAGEKAPLTVF